MRDQYQRIKHEHPGEVLFFRLGDFYEMFAGDAVEISALLGLTLTSRNGLPMCGIPYHAARTYIAKLLKHGKKVAICEQLSEPGKGLIERRVVEVVTPGTALDEDYLDKGSANYLAALALHLNSLGFACIDISSGDFRVTSFPRAASGRLRQEFERLQVRELIVQESLLEEKGDIARAIQERSNLVVNRWADWLFDRDRSRERLCRQFKVSNLRSFGLEDSGAEILAAGALLDYLDDTAKTTIPHVRSIVAYQDSEYTGIDESTQRNLELVRNIHDEDSRYSLIEVMDETRTSMGRRLLKWRILHPLQDTAAIGARLDMVETLYRDQGSLGNLRDLLARTPDLERLSGRVAMEKAHGKDMLAVKNALKSLDLVCARLGKLDLPFESPPARALYGQCGLNSGEKNLTRLLGLRDLLDQALVDDPSILLTEGNLIRDGYHPELDDLKALRNNGRQLLEEYLEEERQQTGIPGLKIRYNRIIGYYMEVAKAHLAKVPSHFIRRQGIAGAERFTSNRLASLESDINGAQDRIISLERDLFLELRAKTQSCLEDLFAAAALLAELDVAQSLARAATVRHWVRPQVQPGTGLVILEGRHPVVEAHLSAGEFIPNDVILGCDQLPEDHFSFALITGPNMAGKSTYLRTAALIVLMAQTGSFVPAREARIGIADRIYCRVGASDNLARGESTFLSEMNETAYILNTATERSLVIMDEVGRGTGTKDGLSIAWAVCEDLLDRVGCRTLFATHYHELSRIVHPRLVNRSMEVLNKDGEIRFLRRLKEGPSEESYGLYVARMAGLPEPVLRRAQLVMEQGGRTGLHPAAPVSAATPAEVFPGNIQPDAIQAVGIQPEDTARIPPPLLILAREIKLLDLNTTTPLETLNRVKNWQELLNSMTAITETLPLKRSSPKDKPPIRQGPGLFDSC
ncbi:MAG: DNA mismatch repair protein MutS [Treponema sp.]|jgi:DNA mismatch repair protein MutS|nr:DNA mismatch repair protein MutS [Treponema sp.]